MKFAFWLLPLFIMMLISSCQKTDSLNLEDISPQQELAIINILNQVAVIGDEIPNPYALNNMRKAYGNLFPETRSLSDDIISATHHYVKFVPKNENDLIEIQKLEGLDLCLYPYDHEVSDGRIDVDPEYSVNGFQHRWCYVPVEYDLSNVQCELEYLYDIYSPYDAAQTKAGCDFSDALESEAYRLCGLKMDQIPLTKSSSVTPSGTIMFWDNDTESYKGCMGLYVKAVRGTHSSATSCNADGQFSINDTFSHSFTYQIHFAHTDYMIRRNDSTSEIVYKYSGYFGSLTKTFGSGDEATFYAKIARAAHLYYYEYIDGLRRPPMANDSHSARLAIQAQLCSDFINTGTFSLTNRFILSDRPTVTVYQLDLFGRDISHMEVFGTTIHELTHAAHWRVDHNGFDDVALIVKESLARGIEWYLTNKEYPSASFEPQYFRCLYTGIIEDLVDGYGTTSCDDYFEYTSSGWSNGVLNRTYQDAVTGYSITEVEEAAIQSCTWLDWYDGIFSNTANTDRDNVAEAFDFWNSI